MGFLTGKSSQKSVSNSSGYNRAFPAIASDYQGGRWAANENQKYISNLLGISNPGQNYGRKGFERYLDNAGFDQVLSDGTDSVVNTASARGLRESGPTLKALTKYQTDLKNQYFGEYMDRLFGQRAADNQEAAIFSSAGQTSSGFSNQNSGSKPGLGGIAGAVASGIAASDRSLKTDIELLGEMEEGINLYRYNYINGEGPYVGVMADEVAAKYPEALGPSVDGYATVDYDILKEKLGA